VNTSNNQMEIVYVYSRERKDFGRPTKMQDIFPVSLFDVSVNTDQFEEHVKHRNTSRGTQSIPELSDHEANTERFESNSVGINHLEGGWPKDVDPLEAEHTIRYRKKIEKDEAYLASVRNLGENVADLLKQNLAIDLYEDYFAGRAVDHSGEPPSAKTLSVFRDPQELKRAVTSISWYPDGARKLACAYSILQFQQQPQNMSLSSYIWDVSNPNHPELELLPASPIVCIAYNPKDAHILLGGCYNGLLQYWDDRKGGSPVDSSPIEKSHRDPVYDVAWMQSKTGTECCSVSTDGQVFWWDIRKLGEPMEGIMLEVKGEDGVKEVHGGVTLSYDSGAGPSKFLVGTEQGSVLLCNRKAKTPGDNVASIYPGHHGPIYALECNPFASKYFLTVGDWTARIWMEDLRTPIMTTRYHSSYLTDGCWSPTRPGVFFTTKKDGTLDIWDYFFKQNDPTFSVQVAEAGLHCLRVESQGRYIATGSFDGSTTLLEICESLAVIQQNEKQNMIQMFERETKRYVMRSSCMPFPGSNVI
jgi:dynein intermediate chain 2